MAFILRAPLSLAPLPRLSVIYSFASPKPLCVSFSQLRKPQVKCLRGMMRIGSFAVRASSAEATADSEVVAEDEIEDDSDGAPEVFGDAEEDASDRDEAEVVESSAPSSPVIAALQSYKEALANDPAKISELESFLKSIEDEKINLEAEVASLSQELSTERDRILRISADFENFRRRTERERLSLVENAQGEVVESLLPVLDNFERAKAQLKVETEGGEEKINNSYQSIYKQFIEILNTLRVVPVETTGTAFDPLLRSWQKKKNKIQPSIYLCIISEISEGLTRIQLPGGLQRHFNNIERMAQQTSTSHYAVLRYKQTDPCHSFGRECRWEMGNVKENNLKVSAAIASPSSNSFSGSSGFAGPGPADTFTIDGRNNLFVM